MVKYWSIEALKIILKQISGFSGVIEPLGDENGYADNQNLTWLITSDCSKVKISSDIFALESCCDTLFINGQSFTGTIADFDVQDLPSEFLVNFFSDDSTNGAGFRLEWSCQEIGFKLKIKLKVKKTHMQFIFYLTKGSRGNGNDGRDRFLRRPWWL